MAHDKATITSASEGDLRAKLESLCEEPVLAHDLLFRAQLGVDENVYSVRRVYDKLTQFSPIAAGASLGGAVAGSSVVAGTFFSTGGILGLLGLATATTPVGWVIAAAAVGGLGSAYGMRKLRAGTESTFKVDKIAQNLGSNISIDVFALAIFELLAPLALKIAIADGDIGSEERSRVNRHFTDA